MGGGALLKRGWNAAVPATACACACECECECECAGYGDEYGYGGRPILCCRWCCGDISKAAGLWYIAAAGGLVLYGDVGQEPYAPEGRTKLAPDAEAR